MTAKTKPPEVKKVDPSEVPEVRRFLEAQSRINDFKEKHQPLLKELGVLVEEYNASLEDADKTLRAGLLSSGPFDLFSVKRTYNAEKLYNELGEEDFIKMGGTMKKVTKYELNQALFEAMAERGSVPEEVVEAVRKVTPNFHKPDKINLP